MTNCNKKMEKCTKHPEIQVELSRFYTFGGIDLFIFMIYLDIDRIIMKGTLQIYFSQWATCFPFFCSH